MRELLRRPPVFLAFLFLISLVIFLNSVRRNGALGVVPRAILWTIAYPQVVFARTTRGISNLWSDYIYLVGLTGRLDTLEEENGRLRSERAHLLTLAMENIRLKKLLDFKEHQSGELLPARVISEAQETTAVIMIDRGSSDGVRPNLAVVSYDGLVGRTSAVTPFTAQVILLQDPRSRVPVRTLEGRAKGLLAGRGSGESLALEKVRRTEDLQAGNELVTSGTGVIYPKGIAVGTITDVQRSTYGLLQEAWVSPAVDFTRVEEVLVIIPPPEQSALDTQTEDDVTDEAAISAAEGVHAQ